MNTHIFLYFLHGFIIRRSKLAQELDKTDMTIHRTVKKLIELNMIRRVGSKKTG